MQLKVLLQLNNNKFYTARNIPVKLQKKRGSKKLPRYFCIHEACVGEKKIVNGRRIHVSHSSLPVD